MNIRSLVIASLMALTVASQADTLFSLSKQGSAPTFVKISDLEVSRIHQVDEVTSQNFRTFRPGRPTYGNLTFTTGLDTSDELVDCINSMLRGDPPHAVASVSNSSPRRTSKVTITNAIPVLWTMPGCDRSIKEARGMTLGFQFDDSTETPTSTTPTARKAKAWLSSNFKFELGDLPTSRVMKIEPITVKQISLGDIDQDGQGDYTMSDLVFYVRPGDAAPFEAWTIDTQAPTVSARINYLDTDGTTLCAFDMQASIWSIGTDPKTGLIRVRCKTSRFWVMSTHAHK